MVTNSAYSVIQNAQPSAGALVLDLAANPQIRVILFGDREIIEARRIIELEQRKNPHESMEQLYANINASLLVQVRKADPDPSFVWLLAAMTVQAIGILEQKPFLKCVFAATDHKSALPDTQLGSYWTCDYADPFEFLQSIGVKI